MAPWRSGLHLQPVAADAEAEVLPCQRTAARRTRPPGAAIAAAVVAVARLDHTPTNPTLPPPARLLAGPLTRPCPPANPISLRLSCLPGPALAMKPLAMPSPMPKAIKVLQSYLDQAQPFLVQMQPFMVPRLVVNANSV